MTVTVIVRAMAATISIISRMGNSSLLRGRPGLVPRAFPFAKLLCLAQVVCPSRFCRKLNGSAIPATILSGQAEQARKSTNACNVQPRRTGRGPVLLDWDKGALGEIGVARRIIGDQAQRLVWADRREVDRAGDAGGNPS